MRLRAHSNFGAALVEDVLWGVGATAERAAKHSGNLENYLLEREILHLDLQLRLKGIGRGATLSDLQAFATGHHVCSARRISILVSQLVAWGRLQQVQSGDDGRVRRLIPCAPLIAYQVSCHERSANLMKIINPSSNLKTVIQTDPVKRDAFILEVGELYHKGLAAPPKVANLFRLISYDAGMAIHYAMMQACLSALGGIHAGVQFRFYQAKTAETLGISRGHIRNFIDKASELRLVTVADNDRSKIALSEAIIDEWSELLGFLMVRSDEAAAALKDPQIIALGDEV